MLNQTGSLACYRSYLDSIFDRIAGLSFNANLIVGTKRQLFWIPFVSIHFAARNRTYACVWLWYEDGISTPIMLNLNINNMLTYTRCTQPFLTLHCICGGRCALLWLTIKARRAKRNKCFRMAHLCVLWLWLAAALVTWSACSADMKCIEFMCVSQQMWFPFQSISITASLWYACEIMHFACTHAEDHVRFVVQGNESIPIAWGQRKSYMCRFSLLWTAHIESIPCCVRSEYALDL